MSNWLLRFLHGAQRVETPISELLDAHFQTRAWSAFEFITDSFELSEHPSLQIGLDSLARLDGFDIRLYGCNVQDFSSIEPTPSRWSAKKPHSWQCTKPVQWSMRNLSNDGESVKCVESGFYTISTPSARLASIVSMRYSSHDDRAVNVQMHVMAPNSEASTAFLKQVRTLMSNNNVFRGRVVSIRQDNHGVGLRFHPVPQVGKEDIILPDKLLRLIEDNTVRFFEHRETLRSRGRHMKRGLLLHGPPGVGKTLAAKYIITQTPGRTTFLLTGESLGALDRTCRLARALQPSTVILEDVDLIAEERTSSTGRTSLLFDLLNEMDGLGDDVDLLFLLTTNRPDILEPALASRPGRIDMAIEVPLPDPECRRRLIEHYGQGLNLAIDSMPSLVKRTEGASAAFIRELLRKASLCAALLGEDRVQDKHIHSALEDMVLAGGSLTPKLLGASKMGFGASNF